MGAFEFVAPAGNRPRGWGGHTGLDAMTHPISLAGLFLFTLTVPFSGVAWRRRIRSAIHPTMQIAQASNETHPPSAITSIVLPLLLRPISQPLRSPFFRQSVSASGGIEGRQDRQTTCDPSLRGADLLQIIADYRAHARERLDKAAGALMSHCFTRLLAFTLLYTVACIVLFGLALLGWGAVCGNRSPASAGSRPGDNLARFHGSRPTKSYAPAKRCFAFGAKFERRKEKRPERRIK